MRDRWKGYRIKLKPPLEELLVFVLVLSIPFLVLGIVYFAERI